MKFDHSDVEKIAKLARLALEKNEIDQLQSDLSRIVSFVTQLNEVNVDGVEPMSHAGDRSLCLRADTVRPVVGRKSFEFSAGYDEGLVKIPKIIE